MVTGQIREVGRPDAAGLWGHIRNLHLIPISMAALGIFNQGAARSDFYSRRLLLATVKDWTQGFRILFPSLISLISQDMRSEGFQQTWS